MYVTVEGESHHNEYEETAMQDSVYQLAIKPITVNSLNKSKKFGFLACKLLQFIIKVLKGEQISVLLIAI